MWFNRMLCHVRQNAYNINQCLLGGPENFPFELTDVVDSLNAELVPATWIHSNCQPSTHTLTSWLEGIVYTVFYI